MSFKSFGTRSAYSFLAFACLLLHSSCGVPNTTTANSDDDSQQAVVLAAQLALSAQDCAGGLRQILPFYQSQYSNNTIRMIASSAYGCYAGVNLLQNIND